MKEPENLQFINYLNQILPFFPTAFIYKENELIIEPKNNIYFRVDNIKDENEFRCKLLEYSSRSCCKGVSIYWQKYMIRGINSYFRQNWSHDDMMKIYTIIGNGVNRDLCKRFIKSEFDMSIIEKGII